MTTRRSLLTALLALSAAAACDAPYADSPTGAGGGIPPTSSTEPPAASSTATSVPAPTVTPVAPPELSAQKKLATASNALGFELYRQLRSKPGNLAMSPLSLETALAMTWAGARGATAQELGKALHLEGSPDEIARQLGQLAQSLSDPQRGVRVNIANRLFGEKTYAFEAPYLKLSQDAFGAPLDAVDFKNHSEDARVRINRWVAERTEQRIKDLIPHGGVSDTTRLALVNAIYFLGDWQRPFLKEATRPAPFTTAAGSKKDVATMNQLGMLAHAEKDGVHALSLSYEGEKTSMLLLLPADAAGLDALERTLSPATVDALVAAQKTKSVRLSLPKLTIDPADSLSVSGALEALGVKAVFDAERADLTGIANPADKEKRLFVSAVFHKAFVKIDERGTEAAAATAEVASEGTGEWKADVELRFDRPFLFLIRDEASGAVLFFGRVDDPSAN